MASTLRRAAAFSALWRAFASSDGPPFSRRIAALPRMVWQSMIGRYDGGGRILLMAGALVYVLSPLDLIPEILALVGVADDLFIVTWLAGAVLAETERFLRWEDVRSGRVVIDGETA